MIEEMQTGIVCTVLSEMEIRMEQLAIFGGEPVRKTPISYGHQYIDDADIEAVANVLRSDALTCGPKVTELEKRLCEVTGANYVVMVSNGTAALHLAAMAAGITKGDEVIVTPLTFAASANCILYCGGTPVFADVKRDTYNIDPESIRSHITEKTKAVVAVDFTGQAVELDEIRQICKEHNLMLIEDAAHAHLGHLLVERDIVVAALQNALHGDQALYRAANHDGHGRVAAAGDGGKHRAERLCVVKHPAVADSAGRVGKRDFVRDARGGTFKIFGGISQHGRTLLRDRN